VSGHSEQKKNSGKSSLSKRKQQEREDIYKLAKECQSWFIQSRLSQECDCTEQYTGKVKLPTPYASCPDDDIAARNRVYSWQEQINKSMSQLGVQRTDIVLLVWLNELREFLPNYTPHTSITFKDQKEAYYKEPPVKFNVIAGDHTTGAIQANHQAKPRHVDFQFIEATLLICEKTAENKRLAKAFGTIDNLVKAIHRSMTQWDVVYDLHGVIKRAKMLAVSQSMTAVNAKANLNAAISAVKTLAVKSFSEQTFGSMRVVATKTGDVWKLIKAIFNGNFVVKAGDPVPKAPESLSHFNNMANIPEDLLCSWLERVERVRWTTAEFQSRCLSYKKSQKIQTCIFDYINAKRPEVPAENYGDLMKHYEFLRDAEWFNVMVSWVTKLSKEAKLPHQLIQSINQKLTQHDEHQTQKEKQLAVVFDFVCVFVCDYHKQNLSFNNKTCLQQATERNKFI
jgi:hypothetical protein